MCNSERTDSTAEEIRLCGKDVRPSLKRLRCALQVREIWLSSEDTGAYGRDIGSSLPELLRALVAVLPPDGRVMLRVGMTNPPFILEHLQAIAEVCSTPPACCHGGIPLLRRNLPSRLCAWAWCEAAAD